MSVPLRIVVKASWLISSFLNALDILLSILFNVRLASITMLLCFFLLFPVVFNSFFTIPVVIENARLQLALIIPTGTPITVVNEKCYQLLLIKQLMTIKIVKRSNIFTKYFDHSFSFFKLSNKIIFHFILVSLNCCWSFSGAALKFGYILGFSGKLHSASF